jgi:hypothetical protein
LVQKPLPFWKKEGAPRAIKAGYRRALLLPERLAEDCQFVTNFNESLSVIPGSQSEIPDAQLRIGE